MRCYDCGKNDTNLIEYVDGRRTIYVCKMCKAEREWRTSSGPVVPSPDKMKEKTIWEKIKDFFGLQ